MEPDRILAFECGADDFIAKPFFTRELSSRIQAVLRRSAAPTGSEQSAIASPEDDPLVIHFDHGEVQVAGERVPLTPREFSLFAALVRRRGRVMSRRELIEQAWGEGDGPNARSVDAHVKSLRRKLGRARHAVETVRGLGYRFTDRSLSPPGGF
jgi:DNA-binding response OmpR family regulator